MKNLLFVVAFLVTFATALLLKRFNPELGTWQRMGAAILVGIVVGVIVMILEGRGPSTWLRD